MGKLPDWLQEVEDFCCYCIEHSTPRSKAADMWVEHGGDMLTKIKQLLAEVERLRADNHKWAFDMRQALKPCVRCDFDEASGELFCHCGACKHRVTAKAWELFATREAAAAAKEEHNATV